MSSSVKNKNPAPRKRSPFSDVNEDGPTIENVAELIKKGQVKKVIIMTGAGISTSAGIPDFRSPETGLYANLAKYDLPYAEAIFDIDYFREHPQAFFTLSKDLYPGHFLPTRTHYFFRLLHEKGLLQRVFTQNIDTLERLAGLPASKIVEAHGSFASTHCTRCGSEVDPDWIRERILRGEVAYCEVERCVRQGGPGGKGGLVKPDIVFFGEALPKRFFSLIDDFQEADLLIVLGTSLKVQPFASLIDRVPSSCPRLLINLELVGDIGQDGDEPESFRGMGSFISESGFDFKGWGAGGKRCARDVAYLGNADEGVDKIATICGWAEELEKLMEAHHQELKTEHATLLKKQVAKKDASNPAKETVQDVAAHVGKVVEDEAASKKEQVADDADPPKEDAESLSAKLADLKVVSDDSK